MKKILFSFALLTGLSATAQLPAGSIAPDFTLTDINGVTHNLYTYLDQGKTVFIDVSATWCGPCWSFHETGALDDLWTNHGPMGGTGVSASTTDDVIVIFIEGDGTTTDAELHGGTGSQGDWVTGVDHPIIDLASGAEATNFNDDFAIGYFPTIYKICPNRIISEPGQASAAQLYAGVADCPAPASNPVDVNALAYQGNSSICGPASYTPSVQIQNNGLDPLTDATVTITMGGNTVSTGTFTGNLATYDVATISCSAITDFSGGNLVITVTANNDADVTNNGLTKTVLGAVETSSRIMLTILTDGYASEIGWNIKNASNQVVPGTVDPTLANNTTYNRTYDMTALGCYTFNITDSYGDGLIGNGSINVRDHDGTVLLNTPDYGSGVTIPFKVTSILNTAAIDESTIEGISVYPNPTSGAINIKSDKLEQFKVIELVDQAGRTLSSWEINATAMTLDLNTFANGNYTLVFKGDNGKAVQKVQVNK